MLKPSQKTLINIANKGETHWNDWRQINRYTEIDFTLLQHPLLFKRFNFGNVNFSGATFGDDFSFVEAIFGSFTIFSEATFGARVSFQIYTLWRFGKFSKRNFQRPSKL